MTEDNDPTLFCAAFKRSRFYLFSRREFPGGDLWDSMVRVAATDGPFGPASVTLDHSVNMSHNTAFLCVRNSTLLAPLLTKHAGLPGRFCRKLSGGWFPEWIERPSPRPNQLRCTQPGAKRGEPCVSFGWKDARAREKKG